MALIFESIQTDGIAYLSYLVGDDTAGIAAVFDPRPDVDCYLQLASEKQVAITHIFETHIHVDSVSGARELCARAESAKIYLSHEGGARYGFEHEGIADGDVFELGSALIAVRHTPGHSPKHMSYLLSEKEHPDGPWGVITGDSLFVNSAGRPDLLGSSREKELAKQLFHTLHDFLHTNIYSPGQLISRRAACLIGSLALQFIFATADAGASVDALDYPGSAWSPYLVGAAIGVLCWLTFYFSDKPIGASSFYAQLAGFLGNLIAPRHTASLTYFKDKPPRVSWGFVFVVATIVGGAIAALTGGEFANEWLPAIWEARFGDSVALRAAVAFSGGMLMAFGARLAGGCTSGHGISGTLQLNLASWITVICLFVGGVAVALLLFNL